MHLIYKRPDEDNRLKKLTNLLFILVFIIENERCCICLQRLVMISRCSRYSGDSEAYNVQSHTLQWYIF